MSLLDLRIAPDPIFKQKASPVASVTEDIRELTKDMLETLYHERAVGLGANMVGVLKQIVVIDLLENQKKNPLIMINPEITEKSSKTQVIEEASLCFPGISAPIERPSEITVAYMDLDSKNQTLKAEGFLATVIQHEVDYLHGITFLDHLSILKRNMLLKKMEKFKEAHQGHVHTAHCRH
jgi:peptide deformylase